ncbi:hypothetical protein ACFOPQ_14660 [Deinococcus antarcticus]|uniref:Cytochrome c domain-containing protein n=1 Tax=Deinococcus antarcticus TaxID=1298767 RepID=A0ABV8A8F4_9DEIO
MPDPTPAPQVTRTVKRPVKKGNDLGTNLGIFALTFLLSLGGGYLMFNQPAKAPATASTTTATTPTPTTPTPAADDAATTPANDTATTTAASSEGEIFTKRGCVGCHSVSALGVTGGVTGPDLSKAYVNVADKHGMPVEDFLKKPNSAVMSSVLGANPLTDDERTQVLNALKAASEK